MCLLLFQIENASDLWEQESKEQDGIAILSTDKSISLAMEDWNASELQKVEDVQVDGNAGSNLAGVEEDGDTRAQVHSIHFAGS